MKKIFFGLAVLCASSSVFADVSDFEQGITFGLQGGYGRPSEGSGFVDWAKNGIAGSYANSGKSIKQSNFAGRASISYDFMPYLSVETGLQYYSQEKYQAHGKDDHSAKNLDARVEEYAIDLMGKITCPLEELRDDFAGYSLFLRGGLAYVKTHVHGNYGGAYFSGAPVAVPQKTFDYTNYAFRPAYGAGMIYSFDDNFSIELAWTGIFGRGKTSYIPEALSEKHPESKMQVANAEGIVPTANMFTFGVSYKFNF